MIEISKELLSEVLGYKVDYIAGVGETYVGFHTEMGGTNINIYELAHKCKEWANKQGYKKVYSGIYESTDQGSMYICILDSNDTNCKDFWADTEVEAIFKACEWILANVKTNSLS